MILIGICGASGSGKSTLARGIRNVLGDRALILPQDCYYFDQSAHPFDERAATDYDDPKIFDHAELLRDVDALFAGKPVNRKGYDYAQHVRADSDELIYPPDVLIIEGIHAFYDDELLSRMALKIFVHVDPDVCIVRRMKRDTRDRGRTVESVAAQYLKQVKPHYDNTISRYIYKADFAVIEGGKNKTAIDAICAYINSKLAQNNTD